MVDCYKGSITKLCKGCVMSSNRRSIVVKERTWQRLKKLGEEEERSVSELIREAIRDLFAKKGKPKSSRYNPVTDTYED